jgi:hypothetical protein
MDVVPAVDRVDFAAPEGEEVREDRADRGDWDPVHVADVAKSDHLLQRVFP